MTASRRVKLIAVASLTTVALGAMHSIALAGSARISAINDGGRSVLLPFSVTCEYADGNESNPVNYSVWTGSSMVVSGCDKFVIYYTSSRGVKYDYEVYPGRSYYFEWAGNHWGFYEK